MIRFGQAKDIPVLARPRPGQFSLGDYVFDHQGLKALVDYLWRGGMPGWQQGRRPEYLLATARALAGNPSPWFLGLNWDSTRVGFSY
ncbi:hypothetical protein DFAR_580002 [Desulfarculales bacterium]